MIGVLLVACTGGGVTEPEVVPSPSAPAEVPASAPAASPEVPVAATPSVAPAPPKDAAALLAGIPAERVGKRVPMMNELSGQTVGELIDLAADTEVFGVPCRGGDGALQLGDGYWGCVLSREATVGGWKLRPDTFIGPWYGGWQLSAVVFENVVPPPSSLAIGAVNCQHYAHYRADGSLEACSLAVDASGLPAGTDVEVAPDGTVTMMVGD